MTMNIRKKGSHTWDLSVHYHRCPFCGAIQESREEYQNRLGKYQKDLVCPRCDRHFTVTKRVRPTFGPFFD